MDASAQLRCINPDCRSEFPVTRAVFACGRCGELLDVEYPGLEPVADPAGLQRLFAQRLASGAWAASGSGEQRAIDASGVWRFRELIGFCPDESRLVTIGEGRTILQRADALAERVGFGAGELFLQYEGFNPSGSFKDNGMAGAFTHARMIGASRVLCASTGNTSASLALFAALAGFAAYVLIGSGKIAYGKLSQALDFGARTVQLAGDFDACLRRVQQLGVERPELGIYVMNSINPFRIEGQKAIMFRVMEGLAWEPPDWIVVPGGNLGNCSAFAKAFVEMERAGLIAPGRRPRLAVINAAGARTFDRMVNELGLRWQGGRYDRARVRTELERMDHAGERARTVASAIEIGRPVNLPKALRALEWMDGVVRSVDDETILEHKALIGRHGYSCEPACAAALAGARMLRKAGVIGRGQRTVCIITGHGLKDPDATVKYHTGLDMKSAQESASRTTPGGALANPPVLCADDLDALRRLFAGA
ncbi:MAG: threonine synthase [Planctomycetota bacterium]|nr:threonine synthase [Planctomycetota bacterium]